MAKFLILPSGVLAEATLSARLGGIETGLLVFFLLGRQVLRSLFTGLVAFLLIDLLLLR